MTMNLPISRRIAILVLGAESAGVFAVYRNGTIFVSENFGDLLDNANFSKYKRAVLGYLKKEKIKLDAIITDLHPLYNSAIFGEELAKKYNTPQIKVQHHLAHIFSSVGDRFCHPELVSGSVSHRFRNKFGITDNYRIPNTFIGIAMDGTGYGLDGNIWGGEVFEVKSQKSKVKSFKRIGSLEEQIMIGGDLAIREPARMIIAILAKTKNQKPKTKNIDQNLKVIKSKNDIYKFVKKFYTRNEFELLCNQLEQNFNCQKTTSTGRILDAVSVLLGFAGNERRYKHEAVKLLEANSTIPYDDYDLRFKIYDLRMALDTTCLFEYLLKNINRDKKRLAATAQLYIAEGFYEIVKKNIQYPISNIQSVFAAGGMTNNKIISSYLESRGVYLSKKIPRGDEGIAIGQVVYYLLNNGR